VQQAMDKSYELQSRLFRSKDAIEGPLAFSQKRKPNWTGE
jgi:crotonobetainyl-CoA hydratase